MRKLPELDWRLVWRLRWEALFPKRRMRASGLTAALRSAAPIFRPTASVAALSAIRRL
jgi:hypothetical protein